MVSLAIFNQTFLAKHLDDVIQNYSVPEFVGTLDNIRCNGIIYSPTKETVHGKNCYIFSTRWPIDTKFTDNILWHC
jgi:hypothetical protein